MSGPGAKGDGGRERIGGNSGVGGDSVTREMNVRSAFNVVQARHEWIFIGCKPRQHCAGEFMTA